MDLTGLRILHHSYFCQLNKNTQYSNEEALSNKLFLGLNTVQKALGNEAKPAWPIYFEIN